MKKVKLAAAAAGIVLLGAGMIICSEAVTEAVKDALGRCVNVIIPALFAFMAISKLLISSGLWIISRPADKTLGRLLAMPAGGTAVFLISNIAGYPVGGAMLSQLTEKGHLSRRSAEIMSIYCYAGGPAFMINAVGAGIYHSPRVGLSVFLSIFTANIITAAAVNRIYRPAAEPGNKKPEIGADMLTSSVTGAGEAILDMCAVIVFFSAAMAVAEQAGLFAAAESLFGLSDNGAVILRSFFEITNTAGLSESSFCILPVLTAVCSFGGICVIFQLCSAVKGSFSLKLFFIWMPVRMILSAGINILYNWILLDKAVPTFAKSGELIVEMNNLLPSVCLIMMIFILVLQKRLDFLKRV